MIKIPIKILIVDDEKDFVEILALRLKEVGEVVTPAYSGSQCLKILKKQDIDVILLDIKMPEMDGVEALNVIKQEFPLVEVIMLTGHGTTQTAVNCMKKGAFDYLLKPANFQELMSKLNEARRKKDEQVERIRKAEAKLLLRRSGDI